MNVFKLALIATAAALSFTATAVLAHADDHNPRHGGVVVETKEMDVELVAKPELVRVYLRDHGKPTKIEGMSGKITWLAGATKTEAALSVAGDALEAKGSFKTAGAKAVVVITRPGKAPVTARFALK